jgi:hypothetical protein
MSASLKSKVLKSNTKLKLVSKSGGAKKGAVSKDAVSKKAEGKKSLRLAPAVVSKANVTEKKATQPEGSESKKVSQKLLQTIEKRKQESAQGGKKNFGKPMGRRGRRPKNYSEYVPSHNNEEESSALESEYDGIEYDTGIRVKAGGDDKSFSFERFEDFDEELNFDW